MDRDDGSGCAAFIVVVLVIAAVVAAVISIAALIDPFDTMPPIAKVWAHCDDATARHGCDLADRFPGFWRHAIANFAYIVVTAILLGFLAAAVFDLRESRHARFGGEAALARYRDARHAFVGASAFVMAAATVPVLHAVI